MSKCFISRFHVFSCRLFLMNIYSVYCNGIFMMTMTNFNDFQMDIHYFQFLLYLYLEYLCRIIVLNISKEYLQT